MPRPKGSKNKTKITVENVDEKIVAVETEIAEITAAIKAKKAELKQLRKAKIEADKVAAKKRLRKKRNLYWKSICGA